MFPVNNNDWITYLISALANNIHPCSVDIVGNTAFPAGYYYLDPKSVPNPAEVSFRMRLNGYPIKNNPNEYELDEFVWGVQVRDNSNAVMYTIRVNASGNNYNVQVLNAASTIISTTPIVLNDNVRVVSAGDNFPCANPNEDADYFLDFTVPTSVLGGFNFVSSTYKLCYFTATDDNVINKEFICGDLINPPAGVPLLCVSKVRVAGPDTVCVNESRTWVLTVTVLNCGTVPVYNVILNDTISPDITLNKVPQLSPMGAVFTPPKTVTWNIGTLNSGDSQTLVMVLDGYFPSSGNKVLDTGTVTGNANPNANPIIPVIFGNGNVIVYANNQMQITKQITSGPLEVNECHKSNWTLLITVQNNGNTDLTDVVVNDAINNLFEIENMNVAVSRGFASVNGSNIIWYVGTLLAASSATMTITLDGFFTASGLNIFDSGTGAAAGAGLCQNPVTFQDSGITVNPKTIIGLVEVSGYMKECKINSLLDDVKVNVYDNNCNVIETGMFDKKYSFNLKQGLYIIEFIKENYVTKYIALAVESNLAVYHDIYMMKMSSGIPVTSYTNIKDIFVNIIKHRVDVDIVISNSTCINTNSTIECLSDVIDYLNYDVICKSKLYLKLQLEKNVVYKLNGVKSLKTHTWQYSFCFPVSDDDLTVFDYIQKYKVKHTFFCKDDNIVYNVPFISYSGYFVERQDVVLNGDCESI